MKTRIHHLFTRRGRVSCAAWVTLALLSILNFQSSTVHAQGTAFTYQGRLNSGTNPATGIFDLRFTVYDAVSGGNVAGSALTNAATPVTNGLFTVMLDFGSGVFNGNARWLEHRGAQQRRHEFYHAFTAPETHTHALRGNGQHSQ